MPALARIHKPYSRAGAKKIVLFVRVESKAQLELIARAARKLTPPQSLSWFSLQATLARARKVLAR